MGKSRSYKAPPGWEIKSTPGPKSEKVSRGSMSTAEGTHMSGGEYGRSVGKKARSKSHSMKTPAKNSGPYGQS